MNSITIRRNGVDGRVEEKEIRELADDDCENYRLLGKGVGCSIAHCFALGAKHNQGFWERVCGYKIVKNDKDAKILSEAEQRVSGITKMYIAVNFYERRPDRKIAFVPKRLEIPGRPELRNFPANILFGSVRVGDRNTGLETAEYIPDLSTFKHDEKEQTMTYYNKHDSERRWRVRIAYNAQDNSYSGKKYCGDRLALMAFGKNWSGFFMHLTIQGVGEAV